MSIKFVDEVLDYFREYRTILGVESCFEIEESIALASDEGRLRFTAAMLDTIICEQLRLPETVVLGGLHAVVNPPARILSYSLFSERSNADLRSSVLEMMRTVFASAGSSSAATVGRRFAFPTYVFGDFSPSLDIKKAIHLLQTDR